MKPQFHIVINVHTGIRIPELDPGFVGPGIMDLCGTAPTWDDVRPRAEDLMRALHADYGAAVRATCVTPNDRVEPFHIDEQGVVHEGLPREMLE